MQQDDAATRSAAIPWREWLSDRWLLAALGVGLLLRVLPLILWPQLECIRDECIYRYISLAIVDGKGLTLSSKGWLPAPGYPYLLAWSKALLGSMQPVKGLQVALSLASVVWIYGIGKFVQDIRVARISAWLLALNPTMAWFTNTLWIETIYIFWLLAAALAVLHAQRTSSLRAVVVSAFCLGIAVLFRGVATYLPPFFLLAICWPEGEDPMDINVWVRRVKARWKAIAVFALTLVLTVGPYSYKASHNRGGFMVSDATVGHVMYLGNNDFPPLTFDYGNGMLTQGLFHRYLNTGRRPCRRDRPAVRSSKCEVDQAIAWAKRHPDRFVGRIPMRLAQILNPNSFLTRHVRWGHFSGFRWWAKEALCLAIVALSAALATLGTVAAWARARGPWAFIAVGTTVYTLAVTAVMYGMTRFRLPLEALWTIYLAIFLLDPRGVINDLMEKPIRLAGVLLTLPPIVALMLWYLPTGFPMFWR